MAKNKDPLPNPLPQAGEGMNEKSNIQFLVAYHDGPVAIGFGWRHWQRDVAQNIMADEWAAMQARGDFNEFNFTEE